MSDKKCEREMFLIGNRRFGCFGTRPFIRYRTVVFRFLVLVFYAFLIFKINILM